MVICLERGADLHMAQLMPLPLTVSCFSKIQIGLPFWYRLTRVVPEKGSLNARVCVCVRVVQRYSAVVTHLDGGLDGRVVLRPPVEALDAVLVFLAVPA